MNESTPAARLIAFFLPQFHPIPENNVWWGPGFTEWQNVSTARPLFPEHYQPHLPADLGFYDLRVPEVREAQAVLAQRYGIEGFCYWHYWFEGRRLLERPFDVVLASGKPEFPFCLAWANETWSRRWLGEDRDVLVAQTYSTRDDVEHARWLTYAFTDPRYIRVRGRPLFVIYRPEQLPDPRRFIVLLNRECDRKGLERPLVLGTNSHHGADSRSLGLDGTVDWEPRLGAIVDDAAAIYRDGLTVIDYSEARRLMHQVDPAYPAFPCVLVSWDNTPRRGSSGVVLTNATPERFAEGLRRAIDRVADSGPEDRIVFLNAWNEWAEGNHLEPDQKYGLSYLTAIRSVLNQRPVGGLQDAVPAVPSGGHATSDQPNVVSTRER
jgi:lipopolysaccharide biosynthesis protein